MNSKLDSLLLNTGDVALRRRAKWLVEQLNLKNGDKVLDVGCGDGYYLYLISNQGLKMDLTGTDFDSNALKTAGRNLNKNCTLVKANLMEKLPFKTNTFDKIVMSEVLEHLPDAVYGLKEVYRVLKPGGTLVLSVPHKNYPFFWDPVNWVLERVFGYHVKSGFWAGIWNQHLKLYTESDLKKVIKSAGFKKILIEIKTHYCLPFNHHLINLVARFLVTQKSNSKLRKSLSKFKVSNGNETRKSPFGLVFLFDSLNDNWNGKGSAVSLVAKVVK